MAFQQDRTACSDDRKQERDGDRIRNAGEATWRADSAVLKISTNARHRLAEWRNSVRADIPRNIMRAPALCRTCRPKDQDSLPPYEVLDAIIEAYEHDLSPRNRGTGYAEAGGPPCGGHVEGNEGQMASGASVGFASRHGFGMTYVVRSPRYQNEATDRGASMNQRQRKTR